MEAHGCIIYYTYVLASCVVLGTDLYLTLLANFSVIAHTLAFGKQRGFLHKFLHWLVLDFGTLASSVQILLYTQSHITTE